MIKSFLFHLVVVLLLTIIRKKSYLPQNITSVLIIIVSVKGILKFISDYHDISRRSKMDFDKYDYTWENNNKNNGDHEDTDKELGYIDKAVDHADNSGFNYHHYVLMNIAAMMNNA